MVFEKPGAKNLETVLLKAVAAG